MLVSPIAAALSRDLAALRRELESYPDERAIWTVAPGIANSAGTLALHLAGNLQHFVGAVLGGTGYRRDREAEFTRRNVPRAELIAELQRAEAAVEAVLPGLPDDDLAKQYPEEISGQRPSTAHALVHLASHLAYHLGQVNYHRRLLAAVGRADNP
jgi:uncharacterized damage-inducible protein DinB